MANNEELSQEVKIEETQSVSAENETATTEAKATEVKTEDVKTTDKVVKAKDEKKADKSKDKKKKSKDKKQGKMAKRLKETGSELKKVTWPKFTTVLKQTGVVLAVTAAFLLVVFGLDMLCSWLVDFIV
ncbi:MAG: preprotein translocase subunit SecE [Clostridia bacterium]|nr:preprotein translocase subunit SecE [Clostridia bacterium]